MSDSHSFAELDIRRIVRPDAAPLWCSVPAALAAGLGVDEAGYVLLSASHSDRRATARVSVHPDTPVGDGERSAVRMDRSLRATLRAKVNDSIRIEPLTPPPARLSAVTLACAGDLQTLLKHGAEQDIARILHAAAVPLAVGSALHLQLPAPVGPVVCRVLELEGGAEGLVASEATVILRFVPELRFTDVSQQVTFADVGGTGDVLERAREMIELPIRSPWVYRQLGINPVRGLIFHGPPGTGKTHVARAVAAEVRARVAHINGADIAGRMASEAQDALRRVFHEAQHNTPSIVIIDEIDALAPQREHLGSHKDSKLVSQLLTMMDGMHKAEGMIVIGTTNRVEALDSALRRPGRFERELRFTAPDRAGRLEILDIHSREMPLDEPASAALGEVAARTGGYTGADLLAVCREAALRAMRDAEPGNGAEAGTEVGTAHLLGALETVTPSALRGQAGVAAARQDWSELVGMGRERAALLEVVNTAAEDTELRMRLGLPAEMSVLIHGPAGNGKSTLAGGLADAVGMQRIYLHGPELFSKWLGETEGGLREAFAAARHVAPAIVVIDQLEVIARGAAEDADAAGHRAMYQLLSELAELRPSDGVWVVATTDDLASVHPLISRGGRFARTLEVVDPTCDERLALIDAEFTGPGIGFAEGEREQVRRQVAGLTEGRSRHAVRSLCRRVKAATLAQQGDHGRSAGSITISAAVVGVVSVIPEK